MVDSFRLYDKESAINVYCLDPITDIQKMAFGNLHATLIDIDSVFGIHFINDLKTTRSLLEYVWTLPSLLLGYLTKENLDYSHFVYLDADIFFYSSWSEIWSKIPIDSISIVEHRFSKRLEPLFPNSGRFNVSWIGIPNNELGKECANTWGNQCLELCPDEPVIRNGKVVYGDQKYLDDWPEMYGNDLFVITSKGFGLAPWNYENYKISKGIPIAVDEEKLIFFHFSSHQYGFLAASKMGKLYRIGHFPKVIYQVYEENLSKSTSALKMNGWKSRHKPIYKRIIHMVNRKFKSILMQSGNNLMQSGNNVQKE